MEFRILGPLEVVDGERSISLGGPKQRSLLALLVLARGRAVSTDVLIEEIWDGRPPETARKIVQGYVATLRGAFGNGRIQTLERGYALEVRDGELDAERFVALASPAAGESASDALRRLQSALSMVRGEPLAGLRHERWAARESTHLDELVLTAVEARIEAELELGENCRLVPELERLVRQHPNRERLVEQLMLALYRSGRQVDALDTYRKAAARLREGLGLEPSRALQELERRILNQDAGLEQPARREARRRRRRPGWRLVALATAVIVAAAASAAVLVETSPATSLDALKPSIVILDTKDGKVVAQWPYSEFEYPWATTGNGRFWLASFTAEFTEIDPRTGRFLDRILPPFASGTNLAFIRGNSVWSTGVDGLARYDLAHRVELWRRRLMHGTHRFGLNGVTMAAGSLWVTSVEENQVIRVNPTTGRPLARIPVPTPWVLASGDGGLWVTTDQHGVQRIDPVTNTVAAIAPVPDPIDSVVVGGGFAWATNNPKGAVYKIDPTGRIVATYLTGDGAHEPSFSAGKLWVSNESAGTLTSIDAATGAQHTYRFGHPLGTEAAIGRYVIVAITGGLTVDEQLAKLNGPVAKLIVPVFQFDPPDPPLISNPYVLQIERATCAGLLRYPDTGATPQPELAAAMPTVSADRRTYTFTLRHGARFAPPSGAVVTSAAIRYSIERALSPKLGTPRPASPYLNDLVGYEAYERGVKQHISGIRVAGDRITFTLEAPSPDFLERLSLPYFCTVPTGTPAVDGGLQPIAPPSAGPYYMASRENGAWTVLRANPYDRGPRRPKLDAIVIREGLDSEVAAQRVESGQWYGLSLNDPLLQPGGVIARRFGTQNPLHLAYRALPEATLDYLALNTKTGPLRDPALRRAIAVGVDRAGLAESGGLAPTASLLPPAVRGGTIPAAPQPVREQPNKRPVTLKLLVDQKCGDPCSQFATLVAAQLRSHGFLVQPIPSNNVPASMHAAHGTIDMTALQTTLPYPDPASFLTQMLGRDVPAAWLPTSTKTALARLDSLTGNTRDTAAVALARRLELTDVPVVAYGTPQIGTLLTPRLGCRRWDAFDSELDLSALCLHR